MSCSKVKNTNKTQKGAVIRAGGYNGNRMEIQTERIEEEIPGAEVKRFGEGINVTFNEDTGVYLDTNKF